MKTSTKFFTAALTSILLVASMGLSANPFWKRDTHPLERMIDHIDLSEQQETEIEAIIQTLKTKRSPKKDGLGMLKSLVELDPDTGDYQQAVEEKAEIAAERLKDHIIAVAQARQEIYSKLTPEQKSELERFLQKKMKRLNKKLEDS